MKDTKRGLSNSTALPGTSDLLTHVSKIEFVFQSMFSGQRVNRLIYNRSFH